MTRTEPRSVVNDLRTDLTCDVCGGPITAGNGWACIATWRVRRWQTAQPPPTDEMVDLLEALAREPEEPWHILHRTCELQTDYDIALSRLNTYPKALGWSRHLSDKTWCSFREWTRLLSRLFVVTYD